MATSEGTGSGAARQPLCLSIPTEDIAGLQQTSCRVTPLFDLEAVELRVEDGPALVFSQGAAVQLVLKLVAAIARLRRYGDGS